MTQNFLVSYAYAKGITAEYAENKLNPANNTLNFSY